MHTKELVEQQSSVNEAARLVRERAPGAVEALCTALHHDQTKTKLLLYGAGLGDGAVTALCDALKTNTTVTSLDLGGSDLSEDGAVRIHARTS